MIISKLHIINFKNYQDVQIEFHPDFNVITGLNGQGKTNLIDSIHYLGITRSYFFNTDTYNYRHNSDIFRLEGEFYEAKKKFSIIVKAKKKTQKIFEKNKKKYEKLVDHIGLIPIVMIAPKDNELINEGSEERRKLIDSTIAQLDNEYLRNLVEYNYILKQRNSLLKDFTSRNIDESLLTIYDQKLIQTGNFIHEKRRQYLDFMKPIFLQKYSVISGLKENCDFEYISKLNNKNFESLLTEARSKDIILQRSTVGIHKDDIYFYNKENMIRYVGSQGQQKSFILALKLAQFELIHLKSGKKPIILLDDIFDKLDANRVLQLINLLHENTLGQIFITDTDSERLKSIFEELNINFGLYHVEDNLVNKII